jgi:AraC-like DNA-binding protein
VSVDGNDPHARVPAAAAASSNLLDRIAVLAASKPVPLGLGTMDAVSMDIRDLIRLRKTKDRMDREFERPLDVPALARSTAMSTGHFSRSFKSAFGESPYSYLMTRRIERAKTLLRRGDMSVTDACFAVGATSLGSFSSRFTELVGESPSAYRARSHSAAADIPACIIKVMTKPSRNEEAPAPHRS